jgi:hypothetical protein
MDQNPLSSGGTLLKDSTGLGSRNRPSIATTTNCQSPDHKYPTKDAGKDSGTTTEEGEHKPLALNFREETPMWWTPQQAEPQLRNRKQNSARKDAAMNVRGKAIWHETAPPRNLRFVVRNLEKVASRTSSIILLADLPGLWKTWSCVPPNSQRKKGLPSFKASRMMMKKWPMTWVF